MLKTKIKQLEIIKSLRKNFHRAGKPILDKKKQVKLDKVGRKAKHKTCKSFDFTL